MRGFDAAKRKLLLRLLRRQTPVSLDALARKRLPALFVRAAAQNQAYADLLAEAGVKFSDRLSADEALTVAPVLSKADLFERFSLEQLLQRGVTATRLASVLTSSGHGGSNFAFGLSTRRQAGSAAAAIDLGLQQAFAVDDRSTLLVNCLPMGVFFESDAACVANVSVREDMAFAIINQAGPLFEQLVLCTDPLFCKRLLDYASEQGFDWSRLRVNVILGEEMFAEEFRSYLASHLEVPLDAAAGAAGRSPMAPLIGSSMGVGELGLNLFFETPEMIALRRACHRRSPDALLPSFFCYNPLRSYVEIINTDTEGVGDLVITLMDAEGPLPMLRYRTGDRARWLQEAEIALLDDHARAALDAVPFPQIAVLGRSKEQLDEHWHVDHFKALLYRDAALAAQLSGAFRVQRQDARSPWQWAVQLAQTATRAPEQVEHALEQLARTSARSRAAPPPVVRVYPYADFPYGMGLDYERKFRYRVPETPAAGAALP